MRIRPQYDLAIIGAGATGLAAARHAARLGARVVVAERDRIGGYGAWAGCVPGRSLIRVAKAAHEIRTARRFGLEGGSCAVHMAEVHEYVRRKVYEIYESASPDALRREGIDVAFGPAWFHNRWTLRAGGRYIVARRYLVCTGATFVAPAIAGLSNTPYTTVLDVFDHPDLPESLTVVGGGPLGMELAQTFQRLGCRVTIVAPRLFPQADPDAADVLQRVFMREGIRLVQGRVLSAATSGAGIVVTVDTGDNVRSDRLLVATARYPNVGRLGLDRVGVAHSERGILVDGRLRTSARHVYAAGNVLDGGPFSHVAGWQALEAVRNALLPQRSSVGQSLMAWVTLTDPEIAQVGMTEASARARWHDALIVSRRDIGKVDRARVDDDEDGFIKLVADPRGRLLGATVVAGRAGELIGELALAMAHGLSIGDIATAVHGHPTYAVALQEMASHLAIGRWASSPMGRLVTRLLRFRGRIRPAVTPT